MKSNGIIVVLIPIAFVMGAIIGNSNVKEKIVYQTRIEYRKDPDTVPKSTRDTEVANAKKTSYESGYSIGQKNGTDEGYKSGYVEGHSVGQKAGIDEGFKSGYIQGTEYGKSLILDQIDLRAQEAERTNKNIPLFRIKLN